MTTWLSQEAVAQKAFPYSWTISADTWEDATTDAPWAAAGSDGYKINAYLGWPALGDDNEDASGTSGACVAANGADGTPMATGSPFVCTLMNTDGNTAAAGTVTSFGADIWGENFKSTNRGTAIDHTVNLDAFKIVEAIVGEDDDEPAEDEDEDSFEDDLAVDAEDDGWAETADGAIEDGEDTVGDTVEDGNDLVDGVVGDANSAIDGALGEATAIIEEVKAYAWTGPGATFQWYQPAKATAYEGLRRYESGDSVTFYNVELTDDVDNPLTVSAGSVSTLAGASTLIAGVVAFGVSTLAF